MTKAANDDDLRVCHRMLAHVRETLAGDPRHAALAWFAAMAEEAVGDALRRDAGLPGTPGQAPACASASSVT